MTPGMKINHEETNVGQFDKLSHIRFFMVDLMTNPADQLWP
jgi:hypothetical protein